MTMELIMSIALPLYTIPGPGARTGVNPLHCAEACLTHKDCGGIVWNATDVSQ